MNTHADKTQENKNQSVASAFSQKQSDSESTFQFVDNRPEVLAQRKLQEMANNSTQAKQAAQLQAIADNHYAQQKLIQKKENNTGLPDNLKTGMENLSGMSLDDVKVHRNSDKPAQLQAHAYAQGTDIHLGPGQEKHLPHEAWHVVQQKQGRVKPTMQMKGGVNVNDDKLLEKEADELGAKSKAHHKPGLNLIQQKTSQTLSWSQAPVQMMPPKKRGKKEKKKEEKIDGVGVKLAAIKDVCRGTSDLGDKGGFIGGKNYSKEEFPHLHIIYTKTEDDILIISHVHATLRGKKHWDLDMATGKVKIGIFQKNEVSDEATVDDISNIEELEEVWAKITTWKPNVEEKVEQSKLEILAERLGTTKEELLEICGDEASVLEYTDKDLLAMLKKPNEDD